MRSTTSTTLRTKRAPRRPVPYLYLVPPPAIEAALDAAPVPAVCPAQPTDAATAAAKPAPALVRHTLTAIRVAMGLAFVVCGLNGFFAFLPMDAPSMAGSAVALGGALLCAGSMLPLLKGIEVLLSTLVEARESSGGPGKERGE